MDLTRGQEDLQGVAQSVGQDVEFAAQTAFASPDRLIFASFFFAPALCWWARTIVPSIIAYSLSASTANNARMLVQTPRLAQRLCRRWVLFQSPRHSGRSRHGMPVR